MVRANYLAGLDNAFLLVFGSTFDRRGELGNGGGRRGGLLCSFRRLFGGNDFNKSNEGKKKGGGIGSLERVLGIKYNSKVNPPAGGSKVKSASKNSKIKQKELLTFDL